MTYSKVIPYLFSLQSDNLFPFWLTPELYRVLFIPIIKLLKNHNNELILFLASKLDYTLATQYKKLTVCWF